LLYQIQPADSLAYSGKAVKNITNYHYLMNYCLLPANVQIIGLRHFSAGIRSFYRQKTDATFLFFSWFRYLVRGQPRHHYGGVHKISSPQAIPYSFRQYLAGVRHCNRSAAISFVTATCRIVVSTKTADF